ncbi:MAG: Asp23/Gls24 family envelope stress response protein [Pseudonocardiales bacterium]|nr:Asp23/Gls24 family envelope stress response protein [Pseudonocardiales bacterium]
MKTCVVPATPFAGTGPGERGRLTIDPSVLRKLTERTAELTPGTRPVPRSVAGVGVGTPTAATAKVTITAKGVDVRLEVALRYPGPVGATVEALRSRITDEIRRITGYQVRSIAVTVTALLPEPSPGLR